MKFLKNRVVVSCIVACTVLSLSIMFLSMQHVRIMQEKDVDLPPLNTRKKWKVPPKVRAAKHSSRDMARHHHPNHEDRHYDKRQQFLAPEFGLTNGEALSRQARARRADIKAALKERTVSLEEDSDSGDVAVEQRQSKKEIMEQPVVSADQNSADEVEEKDQQKEVSADADSEEDVRKVQNSGDEDNGNEKESGDEESDDEKNGGEFEEVGAKTFKHISPDGEGEDEPPDRKAEHADHHASDLASGKNEKEADDSEKDEQEPSHHEDHHHDGEQEHHHREGEHEHHHHEGEHEHHHHAKTPAARPPLDSLISDTERGIKGHVSHMLDWAVIGHAKCATSFIMKWLDRHPEVATWGEEVCDLFDNRPAGLVKRIYEELPVGEYKRGFKCPAHFSRRAIRLFHRYFHNTKIIVGVRHPVRYFESFYNFRLRHAAANYTLPPPNELIGECTPEMDGVCTDRANFHTNLAVFGKTPMKDDTERNLIRFRKYSYETTYQINNPIFLYDVAQFYDEDKERMEKFKVDLQHFLGLEAPMPEPTDKDAGKSSRAKPKAIDICAPEFEKVRNELVIIGKRASMWIRKYFLSSDQVVTSSREHFEEILKTWKVDPCTIQAEKA